jgi:hypothetical protein
MVSAFEGNKAETKTMLPVIETFIAAHQLPDITVVADAGMISEANQKDIEAAGLSVILGMKIPDVLYVVDEWRREHPGQDIPDGHVFTHRWPAGPSSGRRDKVIYYSYEADRARRTLHGRVVPCHLQDQRADCLCRARSPGAAARIRPAPPDQAGVPAQQGTRGDDQAQLAEMAARQQLGQRGQYRPIGPGQLRRPGLALEYGDLVAQNEDLGVLGPVGAG